MAFTIRLFDKENEYTEVCKWWRHHKWTPPPADHLSTLGLVCCVDNLPVAAGWFYITNSKYCWIEFLVANPAAPIKDRTKGLKLLLERLKNEGKVCCPGGTIFTSLRSKGLIRLAKKVGFVVGDEGMTNMVAQCV